MRSLPDYQTEVSRLSSSFLDVLMKYAKTDYLLDNPTAKRLSEMIAEMEKRCKMMLSDCKPQIMLYGMYNAGKSTLLNAMIGENVAGVADKPETSIVSTYDWNGYRLLDTPGLDAPIEHELISKKALEECQVIIFVCSSEAFEDSKIYEEMNTVTGLGKRLLIVINDKGSMRGDDEIQLKWQKIQKNLKAIGFDDTEASNFRLCRVNAKDALDAKLEDDPQLLACSNLANLEDYILTEILRVDGFDVIADYLNGLQIAFAPFIEKLQRCSSSNESFN